MDTAIKNTIPKPDLNFCLSLIDAGFSLLTVGQDKVPNFTWKKYQKIRPTRDSFTKNYKYQGGLTYKDKDGKVVDIVETKGVGLITGYDNLEVLDIDLKVITTLKEREAFWEEYLSLLKDNIEDFEKKFVIVRTINNGYHILYKCKALVGSKKIARLKGQQEALIESRGNPGYVFLYHNFIQGRAYTDIKEIDENDRMILWSCSEMYNHIEETEPAEKIYKKVEKQHFEADVKVWDDYNAKNDVWDLIRSEFTIVRHLSNKTVIRRNGAKSPHSGYIFDNSKCLYLFSTATQYPAQKLLSPFSVYTHQKHYGNYSDAAKELYKNGYGSRFKKITAPKSITLEAVPTIETDNFPLEVFPADIQNYIKEVRVALNGSIDYLGCSFLWVLSMCIGNSIKLQVKNGWNESGVVWLAIVGRAGIGKTHNIDLIINPLKQINGREVKRYEAELAKFREYSEMDKKERETFFPEKIKEPKRTQFIVGDITIESLFEIHDANPLGVGIYRDELSGWIKDLNKYRPGSDIEHYLSCWSNQQMISTRKTVKSSFIPKAYVPIIGGVQPSILANHYTAENKDNGFIDRILLCFPEMEVEKFSEIEVNRETMEWYNEYVQGFYDEIRNNIVEYDDNGLRTQLIKFTSDAKKEYMRVFDKITDLQNSDSENEFMKSMLPKQKSYVARFALLLQVLYIYAEEDKTFEVTKRAVLNAEKLSDYFIKMAKKNKFETVEKNEMQTIVKQSGKITAKEKFLALFETNPAFNRSKAAEELGVSRQTIATWLRELVK